jgi:hypothetical protein
LSSRTVARTMRRNTLASRNTPPPTPTYCALQLLPLPLLPLPLPAVRPKNFQHAAPTRTPSALKVHLGPRHSVSPSTRPSHQALLSLGPAQHTMYSPVSLHTATGLRCM